MRHIGPGLARLGAALALLLLELACTESAGPTAGSLQVNAVTTGADLDPDGYSVALDGGVGQALVVNGTVTFAQLSAGDHTVALSGVAANCTASGANPRTVAVPAGATTQTVFQIACVALSGAGSVQVTAATTGADLDPDGYTVALDGGAGQPIAVNGTITFSDVPVGNHYVALNGIAPNCAVSRNPAKVAVNSGAPAQTIFQVGCNQTLAIDAVAGFSSATNTDSSTWSYRYRNGLTRDGNYPRLPQYGPHNVQWSPTNPGAWSVAGNVPEIGVNGTASDVTYYPGALLVWRSGTMIVHPGASGLVVLSWLSPSEATASISYSFTDLDVNCRADGIDWFVERNNDGATLGSGSINDGGSSGPLTLAGVAVHVGDRINFIVGPQTNYVCDTTQLIASIATTAP